MTFPLHFIAFNKTTKDDEIKKKQRAILSIVQKQRDELQQKVEAYEREKKQCEPNTIASMTSVVTAIKPAAAPPALDGNFLFCLQFSI